MKIILKNFIRFFLVFVLFFLFLNIYFFVFEDLENKDGKNRQWKEFYSINDWNLSKHFINDIDSDGKEDLVTINGCVFLSTLVDKDINFGSKCLNEVTTSVFAELGNSVGQKMWQNSSRSFIVKTNDNEWKVYNINGLKTEIFGFNKDYSIKKIDPTFRESIENIFYQISHLGLYLI